MALRLTMAFSDNPCVQPLKEGIVQPQHIDLAYIVRRSTAWEPVLPGHW